MDEKVLNALITAAAVTFGLFILMVVDSFGYISENFFLDIFLSFSYNFLFILKVVFVITFFIFAINNPKMSLKRFSSLKSKSAKIFFFLLFLVNTSVFVFSESLFYPEYFKLYFMALVITQVLSTLLFASLKNLKPVPKDQFGIQSDTELVNDDYSFNIKAK